MIQGLERWDALEQRPPLWVALVTHSLVGVLLIYMATVVFSDQLSPLSFAVGLLPALWHRRITVLLVIAVVFVIARAFEAFVKIDMAPSMRVVTFSMTLINLSVTTLAIWLVLKAWREVLARGKKLRVANDRLEASNAELSAREEEITRQNEELQTQAEELERQTEELRQQTEELAASREELRRFNEQLIRRERGMMTLLESARWLRPGLNDRDIMSAVCQAAVQLIEHDVVGAAVMQVVDGKLAMRGNYGFGAQGHFEDVPPLAQSFANLIIEKGQTGFIENLALRPDIVLSKPVIGRPFASVLATPLFVDGRAIGVVEVYSHTIRHWSAEDFKVIEWLAAQCALALSAIDYQREVQVKRREAEDASRQKTRFLAAVSHDVRTPANAISLLAELIEDSARRGKDDLSELATDLKTNARTLVELVTDVLDITRIETGAIDLNVADFNLFQALRNELGQFEPFARQKQLALNLSGDETISLHTDRLKLMRVVANLVNNALKFTDLGTIDVQTRREVDGAVVIQVSDTGIGIPRPALSRIFDEFYQLGNPERDRNKGSGLGLAICRRLVDVLGCSISVDSAINVGTTFTLRIPADFVVETPTPRIIDDQANTDASLKGLRILLVEDHHVTRRSTARLLAMKGATIIEAATGAEALNQLLTNCVSVLLLDLMLPDIDGAEVLRKLREAGDHGISCIYVLSGDVRTARVEAVKALGAHDLIAKPLNIEQLIARIQDHFRNSSDVPRTPDAPADLH